MDKIAIIIIVPIELHIKVNGAKDWDGIDRHKESLRTKAWLIFFFVQRGDQGKRNDPSGEIKDKIEQVFFYPFLYTALLPHA